MDPTYHDHDSKKQVSILYEMLTNEYDDNQPIFNQTSTTHLAPESTFIDNNQIKMQSIGSISPNH